MIRLRQLRLDALMTVEDLAERSGVPVRTIYRIEAGASARVSTLGKLAPHFPDIPASELLAEVDAPVAEGARR